MAIPALPSLTFPFPSFLPHFSIFSPPFFFPYPFPYPSFFCSATCKIIRYTEDTVVIGFINNYYYKSVTQGNTNFCLYRQLSLKVWYNFNLMAAVRTMASIASPATRCTHTGWGPLHFHHAPHSQGTSPHP